LTLSYGGAKALLTEGSFEYIITVIREDCLTLKLDQPASLEMKFKPTSPSSILRPTQNISAKNHPKSRTPALPDHRESNNSTLNTGHQTPPPPAHWRTSPQNLPYTTAERSNLTVCPPCLFNSLSRYK
ncbi:hypothetical protein BDP27DRAFT_1323200, partial [Rhodocollybia butyracea]